MLENRSISVPIKMQGSQKFPVAICLLLTSTPSYSHHANCIASPWLRSNYFKMSVTQQTSTRQSSYSLTAFQHFNRFKFPAVLNAIRTPLNPASISFHPSLKHLRRVDILATVFCAFCILV